MSPGQGDVAGDGVLVHADQAAGGPRPTALSDMVQDIVGLRIGQAGLLQDRALALGELGLAGAAVDHADPLAFAAPAAEGEISTAPEAGLGAVGILATEMFNGVHMNPPRSSRARDRPVVPIAPP